MSSANLLFLFIMFLGPLVTLTSANWIIAWVGVELAFMSLIPILLMGKYFTLCKEASLKYFCIQAFSSAFLFISGLSIFTDYNSMFELLMVISLCLKLGLFPGHFWVPSVVSSLDWFSCFLLLGWQKIAPLCLMVLFLASTSYISAKYFLILGGISAVVGGMLGNNMNNVRSMIGASSISHMGWVVVGAFSGSLWVYFTLYCLVIMSTLKLLWLSHPSSSLGILSLSGLPPFLMFIGKWNIISSALANKIDIMFLFLPIAGTVLSLIFYLKFFYSFYLNEQEGGSWITGGVAPLSLLNFLGLSYLLIFFGDRT